MRASYLVNVRPIVGQIEQIGKAKELFSNRVVTVVL